VTDYEYQKTLVVGAIIGASITILALYMTVLNPHHKTTTPKSNFEVVDTYKGCDVVQWTDHHMATYKYFLDCSK